MGQLLFFLFIAIPIVEIAIIIQVGGWLGVLPTVALIILTAFAGTLLLRWQGLSTLARARAAIERGVMPVAELVHGLFLLIAGLLLLTPGFATDLLGLLLFIPTVRLAAGGLILHRLIRQQQTDPNGAGNPSGSPSGSTAGGTTVIEGEYEEISRTEPPTDRRPDR